MLVRAAAKTQQVLARPQLNDRWWWLRLRWLLDEVERQDNRRRLRERRDFWHHLVGLAKTPETLQTISDNLARLDEWYDELHCPWLLDERRRRNYDSAKRLQAKYVEIFGNPDDPQTGKKIAATVEELRSRRRKNLKHGPKRPDRR